MFPERLIVPTADIVVGILLAEYASMNNIHIDWEMVGKDAVDVTQTAEEYHRFLLATEEELTHLSGDDWLEVRTGRNFATAIYNRLQTLGYYTRPTSVDYDFERWVGQDMSLIARRQF